MKKKTKLIENWEIKWTIISCVLILLVLFIEFSFEQFSSKYGQVLGIITGLFGGFIGAIFLVYLQRKNRMAEYERYYSKIAGNYIRTDIGQDNTKDEDLANMREQNIGLNIQINHIEKNAIEVIADSWKNNKAKQKSIIEFNETNRFIGHGRYWYIEGDQFSDHMGENILYRNRDADNQILVRFQHIFPRENENNPDKNKGWEIWEKKSNAT